jgi:putative sigma-54 modulation protein
LEITVSARHTAVSDALHEAVIEKIGRLSRFLEGMDHAEGHFSEERNPRIADREVCEVVLEGHGHHVRCKVAAQDGFAAIDKAVDKLEHQLHKLKTKLQRRHHGPARGRSAGDVNGAAPGLPDTTAVAVAEADGDVDDTFDGPRIVKVKRYGLKPMLPDEAALQLDLVGHDFYFFRNAESGRSAVLYRRADGDLGLIDEAD